MSSNKEKQFKKASRAHMLSEVWESFKHAYVGLTVIICVVVGLLLLMVR